MNPLEAIKTARDVMRATRLLAAVTPTNAMTHAFAPAQWTYESRDTSELGHAIARLSRVAGAFEEPLRSLYSARIEELALEVALVKTVGTDEFSTLAARRFDARSGEADALAHAWIDEHVADDEPTIQTDGLDSRSLLSRVRAEIGGARAPFAVKIAANLSSLAATGERTVYVAASRKTTERAAQRIAIHEVQGHVLPRVRAETEHPMFALGSARGADDQEGLALLYEDRAGFLDAARRVELARRHIATRAMQDGATFEEALRVLTTRNTQHADAVRIASRVYRGNNGISRGLGRECVYLASFIRVRDHLAKHAEDERVLHAGQVAVSAIGAMKKLTLIAQANTRDSSHLQ